MTQPDNVSNRVSLPHTIASQEVILPKTTEKICLLSPPFCKLQPVIYGGLLALGVKVDIRTRMDRILYLISKVFTQVFTQVYERIYPFRHSTSIILQDERLKSREELDSKCAGWYIRLDSVYRAMENTQNSLGWTKESINKSNLLSCIESLSKVDKSDDNMKPPSEEQQKELTKLRGEIEGTSWICKEEVEEIIKIASKAKQNLSMQLSVQKHGTMLYSLKDHKLAVYHLTKRGQGGEGIVFGLESVGKNKDDEKAAKTVAKINSMVYAHLKKSSQQEADRSQNQELPSAEITQDEYQQIRQLAKEGIVFLPAQEEVQIGQVVVGYTLDKGEKSYLDLIGEGRAHSKAEVESLCKSLETLHEKGFVHLDIKPGNIMQKEGKLGFIDWGACLSKKAIDQVKDGKEFRELVRQRSSVATKFYQNKEIEKEKKDLFSKFDEGKISLDQAKKELWELCKKSDRFALGITLYQGYMGSVDIEKSMFDKPTLEGLFGTRKEHDLVVEKGILALL